MLKPRKIIFLLALVLIGFFIGQKSVVTKETPQVKSETRSNEQNPLAFLTEVTTPKGKVFLLINQDSIYFNPFETAVNNSKNILIDKKTYPRLFAQGVASSSAITTNGFDDPTDKKFYIKLSTNQPDHGGYAEVYSILVDPFSGNIKEVSK